MAQRGAAIPVLNDKTKLFPVVKQKRQLLREKEKKKQRAGGITRTVAFMLRDTNHSNTPGLR